MRSNDEDWVQRCYWQFEGASNMTDQMAALRCLVNSPVATASELAGKALTEFYDAWQHEALVVDQWFVVQATCSLPGTLERVKQLMEHSDFEIRNPNKVRSLIGAFCANNHTAFHAKDGAGYEYLADQVLTLDKINPQIASRLLTPLTRWKKFDNDRQRLMQVQLQRIKNSGDLSKDVFEVVEKSTV
jgi:aminopeptidase N